MFRNVLKTVPTRNKNTNELKKSRHELIAHKLVRIPTRTPRLHETAWTTTHQKEREEDERETGVKDTGEDEIKERDRDRVVEISGESHKANDDGR